MDRNTITGLILIFLVFIGFSLYNNRQFNKGYEQAAELAESYYAKGEFENARAEYVNALRYKPNHPDAIEKIRELNIMLGFEDAAKMVEATDNDLTDNDSISTRPAQAASSTGRSVWSVYRVCKRRKRTYYS